MEKKQTKQTVGQVVILSAKDSFIAKSIITKLEDANISSVFAHTKIKEIEKLVNSMVMVILFMSEEIDDMAEELIYLKDIIQDNDIGLVLIGDEAQYEIVKKIIPQQLITEMMERPFNIENLVKVVANYIEENTGEKSKKKILIVDDDITYMRTVYEWLKGKYHVGMASNGVQAISYLAKNSADLVLLDYEMPIADGPQVLSMLKNDTQTGEIPVMFLTGHSDRESVMSVVGLKPVDYLLKTIDSATLHEKLQIFFAQKGSYR